MITSSRAANEFNLKPILKNNRGQKGGWQQYSNGYHENMVGEDSSVHAAVGGWPHSYKSADGYLTPLEQSGICW